MNLKKKYPKAWEKFEDWLTDKTPYFLRYNEIIANNESLSGWLFKFFDKQGIYIVLDWCNFEYAYRIYSPKLDLVYPCNEKNIKEYRWFKARQEAEQAAFAKAFEILEKK